MVDRAVDVLANSAELFGASAGCRHNNERSLVSVSYCT